MGFWIFMLCMAVMPSALMMIFGAVFMRFPPEDINGFYGYRTRRSMVGQQSWNFAQRYWGRCALRLGLLVLVPVVLCMLPCLGRDTDYVGIWGAVVCTLASLIVTGIPIFLTERELKKRF